MVRVNGQGAETTSTYPVISRGRIAILSVHLFAFTRCHTCHCPRPLAKRTKPPNLFYASQTRPLALSDVTQAAGR